MSEKQSVIVDIQDVYHHFSLYLETKTLFNIVNFESLVTVVDEIQLDCNQATILFEECHSRYNQEQSYILFSKLHLKPETNAESIQKLLNALKMAIHSEFFDFMSNFIANCNVDPHASVQEQKEIAKEEKSPVQLALTEDKDIEYQIKTLKPFELEKAVKIINRIYEKKSKKLFSLVLEYCIDKMIDENGNDLALRFSIENNYEILQFMDSNGFSINKTNTRTGYTILNNFIKNRNFTAIEILMKKDLLNNSIKSDKDFLFKLIECEYSDFYDKLFSMKEVNFNSPNENGLYIVHKIVLMKNINLLKRILSNKRININCQDREGQTPLHYAAKNGYEDIVNLLCSSGRVADDIRDYYDKIPLDYANSMSIVKLLQNNKTKIKSLLNKTEKVVEFLSNPNISFNFVKYMNEQKIITKEVVSAIIEQQNELIGQYMYQIDVPLPFKAKNSDILDFIKSDNLVGCMLASKVQDINKEYQSSYDTFDICPLMLAIKEDSYNCERFLVFHDNIQPNFNCLYSAAIAEDKLCMHHSYKILLIFSSKIRK